MPEPTLRILKVEVLSDDWATLKKTTLEYLRRDGTWSTEIRQTYDRGDGAAVLPYDPARGTVLLVRQFRYPAYVHGHHEPLIAAKAFVSKLIRTEADAAAAGTGRKRGIFLRGFPKQKA